MSLRYTGAWLQDGAFNPLVAPTPGATLYDAWAWGQNDTGAFGLNNITNYSSPVQVSSQTNWKFISPQGSLNIFYIKSDGTLWGSGTNTNGELGLGNTTNYSTFKQIGALTNWQTVYNYYGSTFAIKTDGSLWAWGWNNWGQLGLGNKTNYSSPKQVGALTTWLKVAGGYLWATAVRSDGTLWSWGRNAFGEVGTGSTTPASSPTQVGVLTNWTTTFATGDYTNFHVKSDGTLWSWGINNFGQLGLNDTTNRSSPTQIGSLSTWAKTTYSPSSSQPIEKIGAANDDGYAIKTDGSFWTWGRNRFGELGRGNITAYSSPKQLGALTNWSGVAGAGYGVLTLKTDGTIWAWGQNNYGQIGIGNTTKYSSPKQIGSLTNWLAISAGGYRYSGLK